MTADASSELDAGWGERVGDRPDAALRRASALLAANPRDLGAALLAVQLLVDAERPHVAGPVAARLVDAYVRRGDLPAATAAAHLAREAGEAAPPLFEAIAGAFGKGSPRQGDVSLAPPPLPHPPASGGGAARLQGEALFDHAEEVLRALLASDDPLSPTTRVPALPLFGEVAPEPLARLLAALTLRGVAAGETVLRQGDPGREAFVVVRGLLRVELYREERAVPLAALGAGAIFGEMALVSASPRAASVIAGEPALLLVADRDRLEALAREVPAIGTELARFCRQRMVANLVRQSRLLQALPTGERKDIMGRFSPRSFEPGERLVRRGEEAEAIFLIASGTVRVIGKDADGDDMVLADLTAGDVVGEISLVLRRPATADVAALHPTVAMELTREQFMDVMRAHPRLLSELYQLATQREEETRSVVAQAATDVLDVVLV